MTGVATDDRRSDKPPLLRPDLRAWHETLRWRPVASFTLTFGIWAAALVIGLWTENAVVRASMALPLTLAAGQLFTIGHDAGHGSFSTRKVNAVVGRLALVPSVHVFSLWRAHHDVHHRYTNLRSRDFVWTPLSVAEYRVLPRWRRALHRFHRNNSGLGLGAHYTFEIWIPRMLWPLRHHDLPRRRRHIGDAVLQYALLIAVGALSYWFALFIDPERTGDIGFWVSTIVLLFVVPLLGTHWMIGFVIYLNHTHPEIAWYDDPAEWSRHRVQIEGSAGQHFGQLGDLRIMNHTAHHVDPGIPLPRLAAAQRHLVDQFGDHITSYDWSPRVFRAVLSRCKLYDYAAQQWVTYAEAGEDPP